jgi:alkylhydroperoxidase/carboxymuconolactone decarboxylase family protein YurZ
MGINLGIYVVIVLCLAAIARYGIKKGKTKQEAVRAFVILAVVAGVPIAAQAIGLLFHPFA